MYLTECSCQEHYSDLKERQRNCKQKPMATAPRGKQNTNNKTAKGQEG